MGTRNFLVLKTQFDLLHKSLMVGIVGSALGYVLCVIGFIARYIFRFLGNDQREEKSKSSEKLETFVSCTNKYEFFSPKDINGFVEEAKALSFTVEELYLCSNESSQIPETAKVDINGCLEESQATSFTVQEMFLGSEEFTIPDDKIAETREEDDQAEDLSEKSIVTSQKLSSENDINGDLEEPNALSFSILHYKIIETREQDDEAEDFVRQDEESPEESKALSQKLCSENDVNGDLEETNIPSSFTISHNQTVEQDEQSSEESEPPSQKIYSENDINRDLEESKSNSPSSFTIPHNQIAEQEEKSLEALNPGSENDINGDFEEPNSPSSFTIPHNQIVEQDEESKAPSQKLSIENDTNGDSEEPNTSSIFTIPHNQIVEESSEKSEARSQKPSSENDINGDPEEPNTPSSTIPDNKIETQLDESESAKQEELSENHDTIDSSITYELDQHSNDSEDEYIELEPKHLSQGERTKVEFEWEHEDVIEQLKLELRNARTGGLPTIMEDEPELEPENEPEPEPNPSKPSEKGHMTCTRPVIMKSDLSFKFGYKERMEELQKVYNIYAERMRKLDILNSQTMHAIGLQLKLQSTPTQKQRKTFLPRKAQKDDDPALKYAEKLRNDFELVYVGHVCLSWEILSWQHERLRDLLLLQNDAAQASRRYNLVASEFQLFQVLIHRFIEDESFQGPRVQNYAKNRCVIRSLMQVPIVRDDSAKERQYVAEGNGDSVSCEGLDRVMVETMMAFWEFVRKDEKCSVSFRVSQQPVAVTEPPDSKLLADVKRDLYKKERKVKDIQRSGNCVVKRLQKSHDHEGRSQHALFLAQLELRLVSRVLSMFRLSREQLIWCQQKLNQFTISNRRLHREPSFLLFPC